MTRKLHHVGIVADDMEGLLKLWHETLGLPITKTETNDDEAVEIAFLGAGEGAIEIIAPMTEDSGIAKYVEKKGAGQHHVCIAVDDIESAIKDLKAAGIKMINEIPRQRHDGTLYAFTHPKSSYGVMIELYQEK